MHCNSQVSEDACDERTDGSILCATPPIFCRETALGSWGAASADGRPKSSALARLLLTPHMHTSSVSGEDINTVARRNSGVCGDEV
jgi:hypothetical protein